MNEADPEHIDQQLLDEFDKVLGNPTRQQIPAGTLLFEVGDNLGGIWLRVSGRVRLFIEHEGSSIVFHERSVGPIIVLMSFAGGDAAEYSCLAETDVEAVYVDNKRVRETLNAHPRLLSVFAGTLLGALLKRSHRSTEQQLRIHDLYQKLTHERNQLHDTLEQLQQAQLRLVESEKMATLGELSAGVAHDLNNPVAAISRAADYLVEDIGELLTLLESKEQLDEVLERALTLPPLSTRDERAARRTLAEKIEDRDLAARLVKMGIRNEDDLKYFLGKKGKDAKKSQRLDKLERTHAIGAALRNILTCSTRITGLVRSLKSYARGKKDPDDNVDINQSLDETLHLFDHKLDRISVVRKYGDLPPVTCVVGEMNQVWSNLISNAIDAVDQEGVLTVDTSVEEDWLVVRVIDSGPGIPDEILPHIFELNFTTKAGRVHFGMELGLSICHQIVTRHNGEITVHSKPGKTEFTVKLPL